MQKFYISDLHLFHTNIIKHDNRPFKDADEMTSTIVNNWNNTITDNDFVYILGDFTWNNDKGLEILEKLNGHKYLIKGNHDKISPEMTKHFLWVKDYAEINDDKRTVILCHYPIAHWKNADHGSYHLYGHIHEGRDSRPFENYRDEMLKRGISYNCFNVGCMLPHMNYTPRTLDYLIQKGINKK